MGKRKAVRAVMRIDTEQLLSLIDKIADRPSPFTGKKEAIVVCARDELEFIRACARELLLTAKAVKLAEASDDLPLEGRWCTTCIHTVLKPNPVCKYCTSHDWQVTPRPCWVPREKSKGGVDGEA